MSNEQSNQPPSGADPAIGEPPEKSPAAAALAAERELFVRRFKETQARDAHGNIELNLLQMALDLELLEMRLSSLANALVKIGLSPDSLATELTELLKERNDGLSQIVVAGRLGLLNGKRVA